MASRVFWPLQALRSDRQHQSPLSNLPQRSSDPLLAPHLRLQARHSLRLSANLLKHSRCQLQSLRLSLLPSIRPSRLAGSTRRSLSPRRLCLLLHHRALRHSHLRHHPSRAPPLPPLPLLYQLFRRLRLYPRLLTCLQSLLRLLLRLHSLLKHPLLFRFHPNPLRPKLYLSSFSQHQHPHPRSSPLLISRLNVAFDARSYRLSAICSSPKS
jgi:hypothetical protein